jgi:hypothetical protein
MGAASQTELRQIPKLFHLFAGLKSAFRAVLAFNN